MNLNMHQASGIVIGEMSASRALKRRNPKRGAYSKA